MCNTLKIDTIKKFCSWNGFPKSISNTIIQRLLLTDNKKVKTTLSQVSHDDCTIWCRLPFCGTSCLRKIRRNIRKDKVVRFKVLYDTNKMSFFTNAKDKTPLLNNSFVVYKFTCPGCNINYIAKQNAL